MRMGRGVVDDHRRMIARLRQIATELCIVYKEPVDPFVDPPPVEYL